MDWLLTICLANCKASGSNRSFQGSNERQREEKKEVFSTTRSHVQPTPWLCREREARV